MSPFAGMGCGTWVRTVTPTFSNTKSVHFSRYGTYVSQGNVLGFERTSPRSWSGWLKTTFSYGDQTLVSKMMTGGPWTGLEIFIVATALYVNLINTFPSNMLLACGSVPLAGVWNNGAWHHWAVTYSGNSHVRGIHVYYDGAPCVVTANNDTLSDTILNTGNREIGGNEYYFTGNQDEFAEYDKELSQAEVTYLYNLGHPGSLTASGAPSNLVSWLRMGDGDTYPTLIDSVGGFNGTMIGMAAGDIQADVPFYNTKSVLFARGTQRVDCGNVLAFERTDPCSFSWWYKSTSAASNSVISKIDAVGYEITIYGSDVVVSWVNHWSYVWNAIWIEFTGADLHDGLWHHCLLTNNGSSRAAGFNLYIDGTLVVGRTINSDTLTDSILNPSANFHIGGYSYHCVGNIDEPAVYSRELTSIEATWLYNAGHPCSLTAGGAPANLVSWWRMGDGDTYPTLIDVVGGHNGTMTNMAVGNIVADVP